MHQTVKNKLKSFEKFEIEYQQNGTLLIGKAPHIAKLAWLHRIFKGLTDIELTQLESELGRTIPVSYKNFLKQTNGLQLFN